LFIDDLKVNVDGAHAIGMQGIRFESVDHLTRKLHDLGLLKSE
jgi:FMN phosphatase YigB (HAD superfamily)